MSSNLRQIVLEARQTLERLYGSRLRRILLYGSQARGDATGESDIDLLVILDGAVDPGEEIRRTSAETAALSLKHGMVLSCVFLSEKRFDEEQSPLLINVRREGQVV